ncbi:hypothetical protein FGE05_21535 [Pseudomonas sp. ICMP22404]|uniref:hypothetical protein n=1 Tax=Pseudomonas sp. ICMP22404 TaxID=2583807 RepID=UPI00111AD481|nr:hypothetical protein [Pseudomonas sp. ICMP22404]TNF80352.1 hypothetical protein FGE05_21535 [Pseudomonas sp. ICMP22404]
MSGSAAILSNAQIGEDEFATFLKGIGGVVNAGKRTRGTISHGEATLYLALLKYEQFEGFYGEQSILDWECMLGGRPETMIEVQLGHSRSSMKMCLWLVVRFGEVWNCILDDVDSNGVSYLEVCERYLNSVNGT